jgi:hypothetical protein
MTLRYKGLLLAAIQCLMVLSLSGKLLLDRVSCPRVWVRTAPWDPALPIRGRYLSLQLSPDPAAPYFTQTSGQRVLFFVPEHALPFEELRSRRGAPELWAEVTIPKKGPPRPIRLALKRDGSFVPIEVN